MPPSRRVFLTPPRTSQIFRPMRQYVKKAQMTSHGSWSIPSDMYMYRSVKQPHRNQNQIKATVSRPPLVSHHMQLPFLQCSSNNTMDAGTRSKTKLARQVLVRKCYMQVLDIVFHSLSIIAISTISACANRCFPFPSSKPIERKKKLLDWRDGSTKKRDSRDRSVRCSGSREGSIRSIRWPAAMSGRHLIYRRLLSKADAVARSIVSTGSPTHATTALCPPFSHALRTCAPVRRST